MWVLGCWGLSASSLLFSVCFSHPLSPHSCTSCVHPPLLRLAVSAGQGTDEDIVVSSARAYVAALNKLVAWKAKQQQVLASADEEPPAPSAAAAPAAAVQDSSSKRKAGEGSGRLVASR